MGDTYIRVIPRDLFNEANLLKCCGQLVLKAEHLPHIAFCEDVEGGFNIEQSPDSGSIYVANFIVTIWGRQLALTRPLNSRRSWPLYACFEDDDDAEAVNVFTDEGELSADFLELAGASHG